MLIRTSPKSDKFSQESLGFGSRCKRFPTMRNHQGFLEGPAAEQTQSRALQYKTIAAVQPTEQLPVTHVYRSARKVGNENYSSLIGDAKFEDAEARRGKLRSKPRPASGTGVRTRFSSSLDPTNAGPGAYSPDRIDLRPSTALSSRAATPQAISSINERSATPTVRNSLMRSALVCSMPTGQFDPIQASSSSNGSATSERPSSTSRQYVNARKPTSLELDEDLARCEDSVILTPQGNTHKIPVDSGANGGKTLPSRTVLKNPSRPLTPQLFVNRAENSPCRDIWKLPFASKMQLKGGPPSAFSLASDETVTRDTFISHIMTRSNLSMQRSRQEQQLSATRPITYLNPEPQMKPTFNAAINRGLK